MSKDQQDAKGYGLQGTKQIPDSLSNRGPERPGGKVDDQEVRHPQWVTVKRPPVS